MTKSALHIETWSQRLLFGGLIFKMNSFVMTRMGDDLHRQRVCHVQCRGIFLVFGSIWPHFRGTLRIEYGTTLAYKRISKCLFCSVMNATVLRSSRRPRYCQVFPRCHYFRASRIAEICSERRSRSGGAKPRPPSISLSKQSRE